MSEIVLASASPRRRELLSAIISRFSVKPADIPEPLTGDGPADAVALARAKAAVIANSVPGAVVIGADTVVFDELRCYGKPETPEDALAMLARLQGRWHSVATGLAVTVDETTYTDVSISRVKLSAMSYATIESYAESGRPLDKAGAYAIQDSDIPTVEELDGCYCSVMGLPLWRLARVLHSVNIQTQNPDHSFDRCRSCPDASVH